MKAVLPVLLLASTASAVAAPAVTFYRDIVPILEANCQGCHRPGEIGPMPLLTYKQTRPYAKAIKQAVSTRRMPPWFADPAHGRFANDRSLQKKDIDTLLAWIDQGAPEGKAKDAPTAKTWVDGWNIPEPDLTVEMPREFVIPASGKVDYQYVVVPMNLKEDKWVQMVEARPANNARPSVHHIVVFSRAPQSKWLRGEAEPGVPFVPPRTHPDGKPRSDIGGGGNEILTIYTPGNLPDVWKPGQAKLVRAGSDIVFQLHYTPSGKEVRDRTKVGLVFAKGPVKERAVTMSAGNTEFRIPPMDANYRVDGTQPIKNDATLLSFFPHMHLRGKAFEYRLAEPDGTRRTLLKVTPYNFNWQLTYRLAEPIRLNPGTVIEASGWFDNSPNNPFNPDPKSEVRFGEQSDEEMMFGFFDLLIDARLDLRSWSSGKKPATDD